MRTTITALAVAGLLAGCGGPTAAEQQAKAAQSAADYTQAMRQVVTYEVEGDAPEGASLTYELPTGSSQNSAADVPVTTKAGGPITFNAMPGQFLYISAQNNADSGYLVCRIKVDGAVVSENRADGGFAIATCEGRL